MFVLCCAVRGGRGMLVVGLLLVADEVLASSLTDMSRHHAFLRDVRGTVMLERLTFRSGTFQPMVLHSSTYLGSGQHYSLTSATYNILAAHSPHAPHPCAWSARAVSKERKALA